MTMQHACALTRSPLAYFLHLCFNGKPTGNESPPTAATSQNGERTPAWSQGPVVGRQRFLRLVAIYAVRQGCHTGQWRHKWAHLRSPGYRTQNVTLPGALF